MRTPELDRTSEPSAPDPPPSLTLDIHVSGDLRDERIRGGERHGLDLARALRHRGHHVRLYCRGPQRATEVHTLDGFAVVRLPAAPAPPLVWRYSRQLAILGSAREIRRRPPADLAVALSPWSALACRLAHPRVPVVNLITDLLCASQAFDDGRTFRFPEGSWLSLGLDAWLEQRAYLASARSVVCARWLADGMAASGVPREKLSVLPLDAGDSTTRVLDRAEARRVLGLPARAFVVLFVGALTRRKNARVIVDAIGALPAPVSAIFAGDGPDRAALESHARAIGVADRARFLGWLPDPAMAYAAADVLCHPALYETYGLVYPEAMRAGLPIVAPRHCPPDVYSTAPEIVADGVEGVFFDATRPADLAARLALLASDPERVRQMGARARARAATFTWAAYAAAVERELVEVIATARAAGRRASA